MYVCMYVCTYSMSRGVNVLVIHYCRPTGVYVSTLWYILIRDIFKFLTVFLLVLLLFMGCLALAMKEDLDITYKQ